MSEQDSDRRTWKPDVQGLDPGEVAAAARQELRGERGESRVFGLRVEADATATDLVDLLGGALDVPVEVETVPEGTLPRASVKPPRVGR